MDKLYALRRALTPGPEPWEPTTPTQLYLGLGLDYQDLSVPMEVRSLSQSDDLFAIRYTLDDKIHIHIHEFSDVGTCSRLYTISVTEVDA